MDKLLGGPNPDEAKIRELQKEISALRTEMGDKRITYDLEARKIAPNVAGYSGYGKRCDRDNEPNRGGRGTGYGRGYGQGSCCN